MTISVLKFGGTSVGTIDKIKNIAHYLAQRVKQKEQLIVVVSAMGKMTDHLLTLVNEISDKPNVRELDRLLSIGEQQTIALLAIALQNLGVRSQSLTGEQASITTYGLHTKSKIKHIDDKVLYEHLKNNDVLIVAGFQGVNELNNVTTLGRGGSDTSAVALAAAMHCSCEIYTDVTGVFTTDPRIYRSAYQLYEISHEEMLELSAQGAGVLETRCVEIAKNYQVPLYVAKTLSKQKGTWIMPKTQLIEHRKVTGVALDKEIIYVTLTYPVQDNKIYQQIFHTLEQYSINIFMLSQCINQNNTQLTFSVKTTEYHFLTEALDSLIEQYTSIQYQLDSHKSKITVVGLGMRDTGGVIRHIFDTLITNDISFYQVAESELSLSFIINHKDGQKAVEMLCEKFNL